MDTRTPDQRRRIMQSVGQKDTGPEIALRQKLHALGYRFRIHRRDLPGRPDLVFPSRRKAIFVHGCFWHGHGCDKGRLPKSRLSYWMPKIEANRARDNRVAAELAAQRWEVLTVWSCQLKDIDNVLEEAVNFLGPPARLKTPSAAATDVLGS